MFSVWFVVLTHKCHWEQRHFGSNRRISYLGSSIMTWANKNFFIIMSKITDDTYLNKMKSTSTLRKDNSISCQFQSPKGYCLLKIGWYCCLSPYGLLTGVYFLRGQVSCTSVWVLEYCISNWIKWKYVCVYLFISGNRELIALLMEPVDFSLFIYTTDWSALRTGIV